MGRRRWALGACVVLAVTACAETPVVTSQVGAEAPVATGAPSPEAAAPAPTLERTRPAAAAAPPPQAAGGPLLRAASGGDGDSWKDTSGREYRLGLVNTPEYNECFGSAATAKRKELVADGFRAAVYTTDAYGRLVSVVTTASGINLNIWLAREGYANDTYLAQFRYENPGLARQLDAAFAKAKAEGTGLWSACQPTPVAAPPTKAAAASRSGCDPSYPTVCIPPPPPDLDCGDIPYRRFQVVGDDPHRFDADNDGIGCESG